MPSRPFSVPKPLSLIPLNGVEMESCLYVLIHTVPVSRARATRQARLFVAEREHHKYRTEDLLPADARAVRQAVENGRLVEPATIIESAHRALATDQDPAAFVASKPHEAFDRFAVLRRDERTHLRARVFRIADSKRLRLCGEPVKKLGSNRILHEQARAGDAGLAG